MGDLVYVFESFMSSTGGIVCVIFIGALIVMGLKDKNGNGKGNSSSGNSGSSTPPSN